MKTTLEEAMVVCTREMERLSKLVNDTYFKAVSAAWRGDSVGYQKCQDDISKYGNEMMELKELMDQINAAYAAI